MCCTFLPHFGTHRGSRFFIFPAFSPSSWDGLLGATCMWQFIAAALLLDTSDSCQTGQFDPLFVLHQTDNYNVGGRGESRWQWKCQINVPPVVYYVLRRGVPDENGQAVLKAFIWECFSWRRLAPSKSILLLSEHKVTIIHQQMALFKYDSVLNCNGSLQSTSLIGINTSALYEWFTEERQMRSVLLPFTDLWSRRRLWSLPGRDLNICCHFEPPTSLLLTSKANISHICSCVVPCLSPLASRLWNKEQLLSENRSHKQEYWLQLLELGPV